MAKQVPLDNIGHARAFITKFGISDKPITIDEFDCWIIDRGLAADPGTSEKKDNAYKGFVLQRSSVRRMLNTAGTWLNGDSFQIVVPRDRDLYGHYIVKKWGEASQDIARVISAQIETFTKSRIDGLKSVRNKAEALHLESPNDAEAESLVLLMSSLSGHAVTLQAKIAGLLKQYDVAYTLIKGNADKFLLERKAQGDVDSEAVAE
jgi:hypothetical protein